MFSRFVLLLSSFHGEASFEISEVGFSSFAEFLGIARLGAEVVQDKAGVQNGVAAWKALPRKQKTPPLWAGFACTGSLSI